MAKTIWLVWDGASHALVSDLLQRGAMPSLQQVVDRGAMTATGIHGPNSETPPGLMTLFTGCEEPDHGTPGFSAPPPATSQYSVADTLSGFDAHWLRQPPLWVETTAAGYSASLAATAFTPDPLQQVPYPWPYPTAAYRYIMDGYNHKIAKPQLLPLPGPVIPVTIAGQEFAIQGVRDERVILDSSGNATRLPPLHQPDDVVPLWLDATAGIGVYLAWLTETPSADSVGRDWLWCSGVMQLATSPSHAWPAALGPFLGGGIGWHYSRGVLGKGPRITLETIEALTCRVARFFGDVAVHTVTQHPADLVLLYQPAIDEISHLVLHEALADWPYGAAAQTLVQVHQEVDRQLGRLLDTLETTDTLMISSDHGHEPIRRCLRPNVVLHQAGLLAVTRDKIDLSRTRAAFHSSGWILINTTARQGGIVPPEAYEATLQEVEHCLDAATNPATGQPLGLQHSRTLWNGNASAPGDLFIWGPSETELRPHLFGAVSDRPEISGHHQTCLHNSPYLHALFAGCGPGLTALPSPMRNADAAGVVRRSLYQHGTS